MKKYLLFIMCLFILTGCDITYNLDISKDGYIEDVSMWEDDTENDGMDRYIEPFENYSELYLPISKKDGSLYEIGEKKDDVSYYQVSKLNDEVGLHFTGHFPSKTPISNSNLIHLYAGNNYVIDDDMQLKINKSKKIGIFDSVSNLNSIIIKITVNDYKVIENNADFIEENTYTWQLTKDNYKKKNLVLKVNKINSVADADKVVSGTVKKINKTTKNLLKNTESGFNDIPSKELLVICIIIVLSSAIIYKYVIRKQKKENKF